MIQVELSVDDAAMLRDWLETKLIDLSKEINRTEGLEFKKSLRSLERMLDAVVQQLPGRAAT